ncbi:MAG: chorismate mutase, partial [Bacteroidales bacterium]
PEDCEDIRDIRDAIDEIDQEIIQLHALRDSYVREIVKFKSDDEEIHARERKAYVLQQRKAWAAEKGLDPELFEKLFGLIIEKNIQIQFDIYNSSNKQ